MKMTEASCAKCHQQKIYIPERRHAEHRLRDLRARRLLRVPQDEGLRRQRPQAWPDPDQDRLQADPGLGEELDPQSARGQADHVDAALLATTRTTARRRTPSATKSRSTRIAAYLFANAEKHEFAVKNPPRGDAKSGEEIVKSIGCQGCHVVGEAHASRSGRGARFGQPLENIGNKTTYEWIYNWVAIRSTTARRPTCRTCGSPTAGRATSRPSRSA